MPGGSTRTSGHSFILKNTQVDSLDEFFAQQRDRVQRMLDKGERRLRRRLVREAYDVSTGYDAVDTRGRTTGPCDTNTPRTEDDR